MLLFSSTNKSTNSLMSTSCARSLYLVDHEYDESHPVDHTGKSLTCFTVETSNVSYGKTYVDGSVGFF